MSSHPMRTYRRVLRACVRQVPATGRLELTSSWEGVMIRASAQHEYPSVRAWVPVASTNAQVRAVVHELFCALRAQGPDVEQQRPITPRRIPL